MNDSSIQLPSGGGEDESAETSNSKIITKESIITQINQIYNTISNTFSFRVIRQYCRGFKPNILLQTLIKLVSSLQEELLFFPKETIEKVEEAPYYTPIDDFISYISFDLKLQNIKLFCSRMDQGISSLFEIMNTRKKIDFLAEINSCYSDLTNACTDLNPNSLSIEKITKAINSYEKLREIINKTAQTLSTTTTTTSSSPIRPKSNRKRKSEESEHNNAIKVLSAQEVLDLYSKSNHPFITVSSSAKDQYWPKQAQSYSDNLEKNLHQLLYIFSLKGEFGELSISLHVLQNSIDETGQFPKSDQNLIQLQKRRRRRKRKKSDTENEEQLDSEKAESKAVSDFPFEKKPPETQEILRTSNYAKWAETNLAEAPPLVQKEKKKKRKRRSSRKSKETSIDDNDDENDEDFDEFARIIPAKSTSQRHMRPYETINMLEIENKKLEELIRQCPHQPEEVKQLREENATLANEVRSLVQKLDELESLLHDEEEKLYE